MMPHKEETSRGASLDVWLMWRGDERKAGGSNDSADVGLLRAIGIVFRADGITDLIQ
jgi:hypothetical protein